MKYWVYVHTLPDGRKYVGVTSQDHPETRWQGGRGYEDNKYFFSAILAHGWNNIQHDLEEVSSEEEMYSREKELIEKYNTLDPDFGFNQSQGGRGNRGWHWSPEAKQEMSSRRKGIPKSEETKKKMSLASKGKPKTFKHRNNNSLSHKGINKGVPKPKFKYTLPSGEVKEMSSQMASKHYLSKGINIEKGPRVI